MPEAATGNPPESPTKNSVKPGRTPEALADLVSGLSRQQKAEVTYELVLFAALAAEETGHASLNEYLAELEDMAEVYTSPSRRRALSRSVHETPTGSNGHAAAGKPDAP